MFNENNNNNNNNNNNEKKVTTFHGENFVLYSNDEENNPSCHKAAMKEEFTRAREESISRDHDSNYSSNASSQEEIIQNNTTEGFSASDGQPILTAKPQKKKFFVGFKKKLAQTIAIALVFGLVAGGSFSAVIHFTDADGGRDNVILNTVSPISSLEGKNETDLTTVIKECFPSVVSITNKSITEVRTFFGNYQQEQMYSGSGVIIGESGEDLFIVTNYHVIAGTTDLTVTFSLSENQADENATKNASATVKGYDSTKDIAVISVKLNELDKETKENIRVATLGESTSVVLGEKVIAIGNALGYGQSVTDGIISAINRSITVKGSDGSSITNKCLQTNAAINSGNSGGALMNMRGELIGINSAKIGGGTVEGMGYAIPISDVIPIMEKIIAQETRTEIVPESQRGYLGIAGENVTAAISESYGMPQGIYVNQVMEGSAADVAGIMKGYIITGLDATTITSMTELQTRLKYYRAGEHVELTVQVLEGNEYVEKVLDVKLCSAEKAGINQ